MRRVFWTVLGVDPPLFPGSLASILEATPAATPEPGRGLHCDGTGASESDRAEGRLEATEARDPSTVRPNGDER
jgi:hypothetical protein